jgi:signal transduction histidine kinase
MSHELRTPLNQIVGHRELLLDELEGRVDGPSAASMGLLEVITNMFGMSKIEAGQSAVTVEEFTAAELINNLIQSFGARARRGANMLRVRCPESPIRLKTGASCGPSSQAAWSSAPQVDAVHNHCSGLPYVLAPMAAAHTVFAMRSPERDWRHNIDRAGSSICGA